MLGVLSGQIRTGRDRRMKWLDGHDDWQLRGTNADRSSWAPQLLQSILHHHVGAMMMVLAELAN